MPIAFGNELNSSIDHDEVLILGDGPTGRWFLEVRHPAARVKIERGGKERVTHRVLENMA
jgi:hypothetical protein